MTDLLAAAPAEPGSPHSGREPRDGSSTPGGRRRRRTLLAFWAVVFLTFLAPSPGKMTFETKLGVALDPMRFLGDLGHLWQARAGFGGISDQYVGYVFPSLPYYALTDLAHVPVWLAERFWMSAIVTTAFWGALRLAERLDIGTRPTRFLGAVAYALWPTFTIVVGSTSAAALPGAMLPWVLLPLTSPSLNARTMAARSALLVPFMGGVNAVSTLASLVPVALYLVSRPGNEHRRHKWSLIAWWSVCVTLTTLWWVVPLFLLRVYGENFLPYIEQADTTTATMAATEFLRGAGNWVAYLHFGQAWLPAGWTVATAGVAVLCSALAAALGLGGLARRDLPERRWLVLTALLAALVALPGYSGSLGGPFHHTVQEWLDGPLSPFRNIYKFQPGLALALALGLTHLTAVATARLVVRVPRPRRLAPALAVLIVLPGLALPYLNGTHLQPGAFSRLPAHWSKAADWLERHTPEDRALVVPATAHGTYTWGSPIDEPLDVLAKSPWAQRDFVPFGTAGARRTMDAVQQALQTGAQVPGLRDVLTRAGLYAVVVRNDLDPDQIGYVPPPVVQRTLESSGYRKVARFGPLLTAGRIPEDTPLQVQGIYPRQRAVEIYEPTDNTARPGRVALKPVSDTVAVSGGPESLLRLSAADPTLKNRPTVLTGDAHPGLGVTPEQVVADGLRRADTRFGLVGANTSYTYSVGERNPVDSTQDPDQEPKQILPTQGISHQTTAVLHGARSVNASSSGNWLFQLPQYDPVNAFDGDSRTAWAEGSAGTPVGQWLRIAFDAPTRLPSSISVTPLAGDGMRAVPTEVRVETDRGRADSALQPNGTRQSVAAPTGTAKWLKITVLAVQQFRPGLSGAGFAEVAVPGVRVTRALALPTDADRTQSAARVYSLHRDTAPGGLSPAESGLHRQFRTPTRGSYDISVRAQAVPGTGLDRLLDRIASARGNRITVTADSTSRLSADLSPRNLADGDLTTAWIAGDRPVVHLRWQGRKMIDQIVFGAAHGLSARPAEVRISTPYGSTTAGVDDNGITRFDPITTDRLDVTFSKIAETTVHNPVADARLQLPVGLSEIYVPALAGYRTPQPAPAARFSLGCGKGPALVVDGKRYATKVSGHVSDLTQRRQLTVRLCTGTALGLDPGTHRVDADDSGALAVTDVTLRHGATAALAGDSRTVAVRTWHADDRSVFVGAGRASYLQTYENVNVGWRATLNGRELKPLRLDGWQQGWLIPAGQGGTVHLEYAPARVYHAGLVGGAVGVAAVAVLAFVKRRRTVPAHGAVAAAPVPTLPPPPGQLLGTVVLAGVVSAAAGPMALIVVALAAVARWRASLLTPIAVAAMAAAGVVAATGAGQPVSLGTGAFGTVGQALALTALSAALVTADGLGRGRRSGGTGPTQRTVAVSRATATVVPAEEGQGDPDTVTAVQTGKQPLGHPETSQGSDERTGREEGSA
ncbi:alpha-(1-_3)-arabinofuranosyltransferase family protein [Streptomyces sp. Go-475]|uniref:alpha-(1->3)-arabinofuranosyltransferase domain-containing protein n=1 Tax=Streptomyces sp. Go-475 TaxID=2072505 RepID=UPI000DEF2A62|nr:alpha-(1->3)-arabinofuranosyltransferase family protein [Streptomyces sp. Go-475]AXE90493.1 Alpha-(1->3)-arabinofuranosyltransferase [Streptomyces sp. Go-475]